MKAKTLVLIVAVCAALFFMFSTAYYRDRLRNIDTSWVTDSIMTYKNKLGEEYQQKQVLVSTIKDLKEQNASLYEEAKRLKDNPLVVSKVKTVTQIDTVFADTDTVFITEISPDHRHIVTNWSARDSVYYSMNGTTTVSDTGDYAQTVINNLTLNSELIYDVVDDGKNLSILVRSNNPYLNVTNIEGVVLDPTKSKTIAKRFKKRWGIGPYVGVGVGYSGQSIKPELSVGVAVQYSLFQF